jgi:predicted nucleic acid-binding protein
VILVDSSVWIDFFNGRATPQTDLLARLIPRQRLLVGDLVMTEVLQGFRHELDFARARRALEGLPYADLAGREMALASARNYRRLRQSGITIRRTIDVIIATFCIRNGHVLLHADRDFDVMRVHLGLRTL